MNRIHLIDDALHEPDYYRDSVLQMPFETKTFSPTEVFHGIAINHPQDKLCQRIKREYPHLTPTTSFFRKSPAGQIEPTYIHSDAMMGDWTAILYLNKKHTLGDGTLFWEHKLTGERGCPVSDLHKFAEDFGDTTLWACWDRCTAYYNRLMLFQSQLFHSRAILENYGEGDDARLIQVVFGKGVL